ncbi:MAG TPA: hypothetical protein VKE98_13535, partial [Gemmataceae bacterium]|nr:hypothetical protein [Gemmataceae bacterium]
KYNQQLPRIRHKPVLIVTARDRKRTLLIVLLPFSPIPSIVVNSIIGAVIFRLWPLREKVVRELPFVMRKGDVHEPRKLSVWPVAASNFLLHAIHFGQCGCFSVWGFLGTSANLGRSTGG